PHWLLPGPGEGGNVSTCRGFRNRRGGFCAGCTSRYARICKRPDLRRKILLSGTAITVARCYAQGHEFSFFAEQRRVFSPDRAEPSFGMDSIELLWRVGLLIAACLSIAAATANAAPLSRAGCPDRDPALCALYRGAPVYSGQKFSRTHTHRTGGKSRSRPAPSATVGQASSAAAPPSLPAAEAASATALAARFAPIAAGENAGQTLASSPAASPSPWLGPIWMALVG